MAGHWEFNKADPSSVRIGVTQRDQFNNDDVGLAEALVREVIQNSSDAGTGSAPVKVRFQLKALNSNEVGLLEKQFTTLLPHLAACGVELPRHETSPVRILAIEDYNTRGLTGSFDRLDKDNFDSFWRAVGESEKSGQKGGRWGLGKLVYSSSSQVRSFFGLTIRADDHSPSIMGQAVLANHSIGSVYYPAHGFWFDGRSSNELHLQLPVQNAQEIEAFRDLYGVERTVQAGLSVVIPYLINGISEDTLLSGVVNNYYFPILAGKLEIEVGDTLVNAATFLNVATRVEQRNPRVPLSFIKEISDALNAESVAEATRTIGNTRLSQGHLSGAQIEAMKTAFSAGALVHLRIRVALVRKGGALQTGKIDLFIKALGENDEPFSLFARGPITLPGERHFAGAVARGAMIAHDDVAAEFLGDAENPAHTAWNSNAEKLNARWDGARTALTTIRHSLRDLYNMIADQKEARDDDALIDFFSLADKAQASTGKKKRVKKPKIELPARETAIRIKPATGGFEIQPGPASQQWTFPRRIRLRLAYDMIGADPFKRYSPYDFNLNDAKQLKIEAANGEVQITKPNALYFVVSNADFHLKASGFDVRRDLIVDARAL